MLKMSKICKLHVFIAPWNPSTARDPPLPEDNETLHPQGSICLVNKIHALHVEDIKDSKNTCIVVICTNVDDVKDSKHTCIVVICTNVKDIKDSKNTCVVVICTNVQDVEDI